MKRIKVLERSYKDGHLGYELLSPGKPSVGQTGNDATHAEEGHDFSSVRPTGTRHAYVYAVDHTDQGEEKKVISP